MCKGSSTTTATQSAAPQATAAYSNLLTQAQNTAATPYQAYTGELTAPVNSQQQAGIAGINQNANYAQPAVNQALGIAGAAANPLTQAQIQNYQNPYTQDVVNATQAQFNNQNQQQQAQLTGNNISQGALGGNRVGVAQANLAGQQALSQAPTIAGLYSNSYNQGLATANQQYQTNPLAAAGSIANFGIQGQGAALSGAGAQLGAGTLEQQTQQAADTANYGQYAQAQAYPFQTDQWLAGLETGVAPGLGGTSTTTAPPPNLTGQILGAGVAGAGLALSDRRAKKNIHKVGEMHDGQPLYRYQYHNSDEWHIGPIAQEVEKSHPEAVHGIGGAKYVDLKAATDDSVHKASGGGVGGTPWSFAQGWVPTFSGSGSAAPHISGPGQSNTQSPAIDWSKLGSTTANPNGIFAANGTYGSNSFGGGNALSGDAWGGSASQPLPGLDASDYGMAHGGVVKGYDTGGSPGISDAVWNPDEPYRMPDQPNGVNPVDTWRAGNPIPPLGTPPAPQSDDPGPLPPQITGAPSAPSQGVGDAMAFAPPNAGDNPSGAYVAPISQQTPDTAPNGQNKGLGIGFGLISPNAQSGLLAAGLGMLASRSPNLGNVISEGGIAGLSAYGSAEDKDRKIADEAAKLSLEAKRHAEEMKFKEEGQKETGRHNKATEANAADKSKFSPAGSTIAADGTVHPLVLDQYSGKIIDAVTQKPPNPDDKIMPKGDKPVVSDEDAKAVAERYVRTGDRTQLQGLGVSGSARQKVNHYIGEVQKELKVSDEDLGTKVAEFEGRKAGQRTLGTQEAKMGSAAFEAEGAIKQARGVIERLPRTAFLPFNKLIEGYSKNTLNPDQAELAARTQAIINTYSAVMARGANVTTDSSRHHAEALLNTAGDPETYNRTLDTMLQEINMAKGSPAKMREFYKQQYGASALAPDTTAAPAGGTSAATTAQPATAAPAGAVGKLKDTAGKYWYVDKDNKPLGPVQ